MWILKILWETTKCAIRGFCISLSPTLAKAKIHQFTQLENKSNHYKTYKNKFYWATGYTAVLVKKKNMIYFHTQRRNLSYIGLGKNIILNQNNSDSRPSHLLALRLKGCESKAYISAIKSSDDQVTQTLWQLMTHLKVFTQICIKPKQILMNQFVSSI